MDDRVLSLMNGAMDLHVHTAPSHFKRYFDDFEHVRDMEKYGMRGGIIKSHYMPTTARAILVNKNSGCKAKLYGGLTLDRTVGGLNPYAVESELKLGGRIIWLPTFHAYNHIRFQAGLKDDDTTLYLPGYGSQPVPAPAVDVLSSDGKIVPELLEVMEVVKKYDAVLATGHISWKESVVICNKGFELGVRMMITHPDSKRENMPAEVQKDLAVKGAVIEKCYLNVCSGAVSICEMVSRIKDVGPEHLVLTTDFGQESNGSPSAGMASFIGLLLENGVDEDTVALMCKENPACLIRA